MEPGISQDSAAWIGFTQVAFVVSLVGMIVGICYLPVEIWMRGYLGIGLFFALSSTVVLSKTMRDQHEAKKLLYKINEVKTERMLKEFEPIK
jgi:hypothetical protein